MRLPTMSTKTVNPKPKALKGAADQLARRQELLAELSALFDSWKDTNGGPLEGSMVVMAWRAVLMPEHDATPTKIPSIVAAVLKDIGDDEANKARDLLHQIYPALWASAEQWAALYEKNKRHFDSLAKQGHKDFSRLLDEILAMPSGMAIAEVQKKAAREGAYVPPSRAGKRGYTVYLSDAVAQEMKELAHAKQTTLTQLFEQAIDDLLARERPVVEAVRQALQGVKPK